MVLQRLRFAEERIFSDERVFGDEKSKINYFQLNQLPRLNVLHLL